MCTFKDCLALERRESSIYETALTRTGKSVTDADDQYTLNANGDGS